MITGIHTKKWLQLVHVQLYDIPDSTSYMPIGQSTTTCQPITAAHTAMVMT